MDDRQFDRLARFVASPATRRATLGALAALGLGTAPGIGPAVKAKKKKKKKKKPPKDDLPTCLVECGSDCCTAAQPACCSVNTAESLCYDPATEECCPDLDAQLTAVCPPGTRCEYIPGEGFYRNYCCPRDATTCGYACCRAGTTCCFALAGDPASAFCCANGSCDPLDLTCENVFDVDPRYL